MQQTFYAVIPAGGAGTRLWPLSRRSAPKFLHDLTGSGRTLLQATWDRLAPLTDAQLVVTGTAHAAAVADQLPDLPLADLLAEPSPRDSMAAIGLAAAVLLARHPDQDPVIGSFAADHAITGTEEFTAAARTAVELARADYVATIGIQPTGPSTAFGYIHLGEAIPGIAGAHQVRSFTEKPDADTAADYLATGAYRWNAGMFVVRAQVLLAHLDRLQPALATGLHAIATAWDTPEQQEVLAREWPALTRIAIDHAIAEPVAATGGVAVVPADFGWDDVGDWASLAALLRPAPGQGGDGARVLGEESRTLIEGSPGALVVPGSGRRVILLHQPGAVVVDTPDALLVTTTDQAQRVKDVVTGLQSDPSGADLL